MIDAIKGSNYNPYTALNGQVNVQSDGTEVKQTAKFDIQSILSQIDEYTYTKEDAEKVIDLIEKYQKECFKKYGIHFIHASDEWYIMAERELPEEERYDGYLQLENGVGMLRLLLEEFHEELEKRKERKAV